MVAEIKRSLVEHLVLFQPIYQQNDRQLTTNYAETNRYEIETPSTHSGQPGPIASSIPTQ